jgi:hypothetical protein
MEADDDITGVADLEYTVRKNGRVTVPWSSVEGPIRVDAASVVTVRAADWAGNVTDDRSVTLHELRR